jgi:anthraniloyl-CoA monooxygenase
MEVLRAVRGAWAGPLIARIGRPGTVALAVAAREAGADCVHVVAGHARAESAPEYRRGYLTDLADRVRNAARVPTIVGGYLTTLDEANTIVGAGRADLVLLDLPETEIERPLRPSNSLLLGEVPA